MTGKGGLASAPERRLRLMMGALVFWLALVFVMGIWWSRLVLDQASRIATLEYQSGLVHEAGENQLRTQRMVFWESLTYFVLLTGSAGVVFWIYWRDVRRSRGVQAFFASMTHELRTPLTSIRLQAESIAENLGADPAQKPLVERLLEDTMRLESQVERTLELARVEGGGPVFPETLELKPWMDRLVAAWKEAYGERVKFETEIDDITAYVDPTALLVIMKNLLENSLRHAKQSVVLVRLSARSIEGGVSIIYRDNGSGFKGDERRLGRIFQKGAGSQGAGVGLYLISVLMEQMGGWTRFKGGVGFEVQLWLKGGMPSG